MADSLAGLGLDDDSNVSIVALSYSDKIIGVACYSELTNSIFADAINISSRDLERVLFNVKSACKPSIFLIQPQILTNKDLFDLILTGPDNSPQYYRYQILKSSTWNHDSAMEIICTKLLTSATKSKLTLSKLNKNTNYLWISSVIDLDSIYLRQALGALLKYMQANTLRLDDGLIIVSSIKPLPSHDYLRIDESSYRSLQIFSEEIHPNVIKGTGLTGSKEGFSLFALFDRTRSPPGRRLLRLLFLLLVCQVKLSPFVMILFDFRKFPDYRCNFREWMLRPLCDKGVINNRLDGIGLVVNQGNREFVIEILKVLRRIKDLPKILLRIKKVEATFTDWCNLALSISASLDISEQMYNFTQDDDKVVSERNFVTRLIQSVNFKSLHEVRDELSLSIDIEESIATSSVYIKDGTDRELDRLRNIYNHLEEELTIAAHKILKMAPLLQHVSVEYVPQIGYLIAVSENESQFLTCSGSTACTPTNSCVGTPPELGSLHHASQRSTYLCDADVDGTEYHSDTIEDNYHMTTSSFCGQPQLHDNKDCRFSSQSDKRLNGQSYAEFDSTRKSQQGNNQRYYSDNHNGDGQYVSAEDLNYQHSSKLNQDGPRAIRPSGVQFVYHQAGKNYYKNEVVYELDEKIGDVKNHIIDRQKQLLLLIEDKLLEFESSLHELTEILATMDVIISLGMIAFENNFCRPEIADINVIVIKNGRHPLQELAIDRFVPNDTLITPDRNIALITGPNSSGKSVYLKQVGLMVYLAQFGSYLPCEKAVIGLTDEIFTRISSLETVSSSHSSFSLDLSQISKMLSRNTPRSLCLIDEFGKGTSPVDGIALLATTIRHLAKNKTKAIFVLHFTEVLHPDIMPQNILGSITVFQMETFKPPDTDNQACLLNSHEDLEAENLDPTPLYKLKIGVSKSSEGIACARNAGVSESVCKRAQFIKDCIVAKYSFQPVPMKRAGILDKESVRSMLQLFLSVPDWLNQGQHIIDKVGSDCVQVKEGNCDTENPRRVLQEMKFWINFKI